MMFIKALALTLCILMVTVGDLTVVTAGTVPGDGIGSTKLLTSADTGDLWSGIQSVVAVNNEGGAVAAWQETDSSNASMKDIVAMIYSNGIWGDRTILITSPGYFAEIKVAMNDNGDAAIGWLYNAIAFGQSEVWSCFYSSGHWNTPGTLPTGSSSATSLNVAIDASGDLLMAWEQENGSYGVFADRWSNGNWDSPTYLGTLGRVRTDMDLAMNTNGTAMAVWVQWDPMNMYLANITASTYQNGEWSGPQNISTTKEGGIDPQVVINDRGDALVVWLETSLSIDGISCCMYKSGVWGPQHCIDSVDYNQLWAQPGIADDGRAMIVWSGANALGQEFFIDYNSYDGTNWSAPVRFINGYTSTLTGYYYAMNGEGDAMMEWACSANGSAPIGFTAGDAYYCSYTGGSWGDRKSYRNVSDINTDEAAALDLNDDGLAFMLWVEKNGTANDLYAIQLSLDADSSTGNSGTADAPKDAGNPQGDDTQHTQGNSGTANAPMDAGLLIVVAAIIAVVCIGAFVFIRGRKGNAP